MRGCSSQTSSEVAQPQCTCLFVEHWRPLDSDYGPVRLSCNARLPLYGPLLTGFELVGSFQQPNLVLLTCFVFHFPNCHLFANYDARCCPSFVLTFQQLRNNTTLLDTGTIGLAFSVIHGPTVIISPQLPFVCEGGEDRENTERQHTGCNPSTRSRRSTPYLDRTSDSEAKHPSKSSRCVLRGGW